MVFSSNIFMFFFLPITLGLYYLIKNRYRKNLLILASFVFFIWTQPKVWWILLLSIGINYAVGMLVDVSKSCSTRYLWLFVGVAGNLIPLFYCKYLNFGIDIINSFTNNGIPIKEISLPLGISFLTFSGISYVADIYQRKIRADKNLLNVALYIAFFPKLFQGPIARYEEILPPRVRRGHISVDDFVYGIERFIIGLAKKTIIGDSLGWTVDAIWNAGVAQNTPAIGWLGSCAYTLQIFFDFAGYSDMAIGLGRMFGFHIPENFNLPYTSKSISEFWRRWHITLGNFFRDYVYIPLGGNRKGTVRTYVNLAVVFFLTGLWHGASYHFVIWGLFNGLFMLIERFLRIHNIQANWMPKKLKELICTLYTLFVTNIAWIFFRAPDTYSAWNFIQTMFGIGLGNQPGYKITWYLDRWTIFVLVLAVILSSSLPTRIARKIWDGSKIKTSIKYIFLLLLMYLSILCIVSGNYNAFIYFQF